MRDGRLRAFLSGLGLGYVQTAATIVVGLWMTPYLLRHLGSRDYGLWLLGTQVLTYLALLDLGVVALVPREVAAAAGRGPAERPALKRLIAETASLVLWQLPAVAVVGGLIVWLMPADWISLRWPLAAVVVAFVISFPFRIFSAALQGLQDLAVLGIVQFSAWAAGVVVTFIGAATGWGLYSLAFGWMATQLVTTVATWRRFVHAYADVMPSDLPRLSVTEARRQLSRGAWISVNQIAQVLLVGTDLVVIGHLLGPAAVVPFACTARLTNLLANQPQMFMQMALPALSELRTSASRDRLFDVAKSMAQVMLIFSGGITCVVLAVNRPFVRWWVGEERFAGIGLTALVLAGMLARHINVTAIYTLFCFGNERRLALTAIADGLVGVIAMLVLVPVFGQYGAALGPLIATCVVSIPNNFAALSRELGSAPLEFLRPLRAWLVRYPAVLAAAVFLSFTWDFRGLSWFAPAAAAVGITYALTMRPAIRTPPLGALLGPRLHPTLAKLAGFAKRGEAPVDQQLGRLSEAQ